MVEQHGHRHQRQRQPYGLNRNLRDEKIAHVINDQLNLINDPVPSSVFPNIGEEKNINDDESQIQKYNDISSKLLNPEERPKSGIDPESSSREDTSDSNWNFKIKMKTSNERESSINAEEKAREFCKTPSVSVPIQHCTTQTLTKKFRPKVCAKGDAICIPANYSKFDLPNEFERTEVRVHLIPYGY